MKNEGKNLQLATEGKQTTDEERQKLLLEHPSAIVKVSLTKNPKLSPGVSESLTPKELRIKKETAAATKRTMTINLL